MNEKPKIRCTNCSKVIITGYLKVGMTVIECRYCGENNTIVAEKPSTEKASK